MCKICKMRKLAVAYPAYEYTDGDGRLIRAAMPVCRSVAAQTAAKNGWSIRLERKPEEAGMVGAMATEIAAIRAADRAFADALNN